ncbi:MAG TPA: hypothetical protein VGQ67_08310 [Candidatus Polarisedimenticolia bacterium]|nr:hypothetical protein [Candidatus Polarisedimenticolia bacterium]
MNRSFRSGLAMAAALGIVALIPALAADSQGDRVLVTRPGVVFHKAGSDDIRGKALEKTMDGALEAGYAPCPVCFAKEIQAASMTAKPGGGAMMAGRLGAEGIPAPPVTTVVQPFGVRYAVDHTRTPKDAIRNPYEDVSVVVPGRAEQGAYASH